MNNLISSMEQIISDTLSIAEDVAEGLSSHHRATRAQPVCGCSGSTPSAGANQIRESREGSNCTDWQEPEPACQHTACAAVLKNQCHGHPIPSLLPATAEAFAFPPGGQAYYPRFKVRQPPRLHPGCARALRALRPFLTQQSVGSGADSRPCPCAGLRPVCRVRRERAVHRGLSLDHGRGTSGACAIHHWLVSPVCSGLRASCRSLPSRTRPAAPPPSPTQAFDAYMAAQAGAISASRTDLTAFEQVVLNVRS